MNPFFTLLCFALQLATCGPRHEFKSHMATQDFEFVSGNRSLSGMIDQPTVAVMLFIHGSGCTDIRANNMYIDLRSRFAKLGIANSKRTVTGGAGWVGLPRGKLHVGIAQHHHLERQWRQSCRPFGAVRTTRYQSLDFCFRSGRYRQ